MSRSTLSDKEKERENVRGLILIRGLRIFDAKYAVLSFAAERVRSEAAHRSSSGFLKGKEKNWGPKHSVLLENGCVSFDRANALEFQFRIYKYQAIIVDVSKFSRHPRRLIGNHR